jgi:general secretion pathway protein D
MSSPVKELIGIVGLGLLLFGCSEFRPSPAPTLTEQIDERLAVIEEPSEDGTGDEAVSDEAFAAATEPLQTLETQVSKGTGQFIDSAAARARPEAAPKSGDIILNFQAADLQEVVKVVLGDLLGQNYVIDPNVSGTVSTDTTQGLAKEDLLPVLETLLALNQAGLIKEQGVYRVVPLSKALKGSIRPEYEVPRIDSGLGIQIIPLRFIAVAEMQKILEPILSDGSLVYADEKRNLLLLAGTPPEQARYRETIRMFDVDWMRGMSVGLYPLTYVEPQDLIKELEQALGGEGGAIMDGLVRLVAIERLAALLAVSPSVHGIYEIERWIERLDVASDQSAPRLFVYRLQNAKAVDVAALLTDIFSDVTGSTALPGVELAPGTRPVTLSSPDAGEGAPPPLLPDRPPGSGISVAVGETLRIIADEPYNALVILATPQEYEIVESAIRKLDVIPLQVLIEATIVEITISASLQYGVEWFFKHHLPDSKKGSGLLDLGEAGLVPFAPAFSYTIVNGPEDVRAVVNMLAGETRVDILSSPSLMVLDNQTATINVGDEIPIPTRASTSTIDSTAPIVNDIEYRATGVTLTVTPHVNAGGLVTMDVEQEVSNAVITESSGLDAPTIQQRTITTSVAVQSGDTIVLGGLIATQDTVTESGVPYLRKIPVLGKLFGQTSDTSDRKELLVLISPRAVNDGHEARDVTREYRDKLHGLSGEETRRVPY